MKNSSVSIFAFLVIFLPSFAIETVKSHGTSDKTEQWGYVEVRPKAHMFWWFYKSPVGNESMTLPTVLWLQGGPGSSGVGIGNFLEIGPLDSNLKPRNSTWLQFCNLLFVDNPVGTGYSYVENTSLLVETDEEVASDLTQLLKQVSNENLLMQKSPLYIFGESYGGKFAVTLGLSIVNSVKSGDLRLKFGGVAVGDSWISPEDFVFSWGPLLLDLSRLDSNQAAQSNSLAEKIKIEIDTKQYVNATNTWGELENLIISSSNSIDFYNFLLDANMDPLNVVSTISSSNNNELNLGVSMQNYGSYLRTKLTANAGSLSELMNGVIREKLEIIPKDVSWGEQSNDVFNALSGDFMKPRIAEVGELISLGVNVTVYSGQLDVICATKGTEAWVRKLKWEGLKNFTSLKREPVYCNGKNGGTKGFYRSFQNFHFYWVLEAGHFVPYDQPCVALKIVKETTQSPAPYA